MRNTKPPEDVFQTSLHSLKNSNSGFGPTNETRDKDSQFIDMAKERWDKLEANWIYTESSGIGNQGVVATSDPLDPRRHRRGAKLATLPPASEPPPVPKGPIGRN